MSTLTILLPTANRIKKLTRTLNHYKEFIDKEFQVYILDGSKNNMEEEININLPNNFIFQKYDPKLGPFDRVHKFIKTNGIKTKYVCIANDEDIILSKYIQNSIKFLEKNQDYSGYFGSILTFLKPLLKIPRVSLHKSGTQEDLDINSNNNIERLITYLTLNINIVPFTFYSVRRSKDFLKLYTDEYYSLEMYGMSEELLDQINFPLSGKMFFSDELMVLRDESKCNHIEIANKEHPEESIPSEDIDTILSFIKNNYEIDFASCEVFFNAFYKKKVFSLMSSSGHKFIHKKSILGKKFSRVIGFYLKSTQVILEIIQFFYLNFKTKDDENKKAIKKISKLIPTQS